MTRSYWDFPQFSYWLLRVTIIAMTNEQREFILNPPPGSALARARDYGIDLTMLARNLELTPDERLESAMRAIELSKELDHLRATGRRG